MSRNVKSARVIYTRRPNPIPKKSRGGQGSNLIKRGVQLAIGLVVIYGLWHVFAITKITVEGTKAIPVADITKAADTSLSHHALSRNLLGLNSGALKSDLLQDQRLSDVKIKRVWPSGLTLVVSERQINLGWKTAGQVYLLDSNGVVVGLAGQTSTSLPVVTDSTGLPVKVGDRVVPQSFASFVAALAGELTPKTGLKIADMSVPDTTSELYVKTTVGYSVKFDTTSGVEDQLTSLKTVLATLARIKKTPTQYIDLRVPGKAYYL